MAETNLIEHKRREKLQMISHSRKLSDISMEAAEATLIEKEKTVADVQVIRNALNKHFIFTSLTEENIEVIIANMSYYVIEKGNMLFAQGQPAKKFYVLIMGTMEVLVNEKQVAIMSAGTGFGELALLHGTPRTATILALEDWSLWAVDRRTFRQSVQSVNTVTFAENAEFIHSVPMLAGLTPQQKSDMVYALTSHKFTANTRIVNEGDPGDLFYLIKEGYVSWLHEGIEIRRLQKGDFFGELALLYNSPRTATVVAMTEVKWVSLGREDVNKLLGGELQQILYRNTLRISFEQNEYLARLTPQQREAIIDQMKILQLKAGDVVRPAGSTSAQQMHVVLKGEVHRQEDSTCVAAKFQSIGVENIFNEIVYEEDDTLIASDFTAVGEITNQKLQEILGGKLSDIAEFYDIYEVLKEVSLLRGLRDEIVKDIVPVLELNEYNDGDMIVEQQTLGNHFYIIKSGKVDVYKDNQKVRTITKYDYFGERAIIFNDYRTASVYANGPAVCWSIKKQNFLELIDEQIYALLIKKIEMQDFNIGLENLKPVKALGNGMFGNVALVGAEGFSELFAMKSVTRQKIEAYRIHKASQLEREILLQWDHTMIMKLIRTYKDEKRVYFLTEFVNGIDLFDAIREIGLLKNEQAKFYAACLLNTIEYLHERDIMYRDLKPENVIIGQDGYPKLIDLGNWTICKDRTYTVLGTPHYMAPELITGQGYEWSVDYWSLGIMVYEFLWGGVPFGDDLEDPLAIYERVLMGTLEYPRYVDPQFEGRSMIERLLSRQPAFRKGADIGGLSNHVWFLDFNWRELLTKQMKPPFIPPDSTRIQNTPLPRSVTLDEFLDAYETGIDWNRRPNTEEIPGEDWDANF